MYYNTSQNISLEKSVESCYMTYVVLKPTTSYFINSVVGCIVNAIFAVLGAFLNALVVCVFWKTPRLRYKVSYFMIMVLSSIDLCVSLIVHPFHLINSIAEITETSKCFYKMFYQTSAVIFSGMSFMTFFIMNIERYLSIVHPFFHINHVTKEKCLLCSCLLWIVCMVTGVAPVFKLNIQTVVTVLALIVIFATFYIYIAIYLVAKKRRNIKRKRRAASGTQDNLVVSEDLPSQDSLYQKKKVSFLHDIQLAKMYLLVVFSSLFLNFPNALVLAMYSARIKDVNNVVQVKIWTVTLVAMNSTVNCLIFFWSNKKLRSEGWKICKEFLKS